ncbi:MAG: hypothetical protein ABSF26_22635 [Thermoguttaceae bacterium]|jgi:hypothetical protein
MRFQSRYVALMLLRSVVQDPLVAWSVVENKGTLVTVVRHDGDFVATASYQSGEETVIVTLLQI